MTTEMDKLTYDSSSIRVLEGVEGVRKRPAMYIGDTSFRGLHHLVEELVANSVDEALAGFCQHITVTIHVDGSVSVTDDGRGIPTGVHPEFGVSGVELVLTRLHAGGKFDHKSYKVSGGLHGVGLSVVNALSEYLELEVWQNGKTYFQRYHRGVPASDLQERGSTKKRGTKILFKPDPEIFEETEFRYETIASRLRELAYLTRGLTIEITDERSNRTETFHYEGGIREFVAHLNEGKDLVHNEPIYFEQTLESVIVEIAFQYNTGFSTNDIFSFANNVRTSEGGTHVAGFRAALTRTFNNYARNHNLLKKDEVVPKGDDYLEGLVAVISVKVPEPQFEGQTKAKLGNRDVQGIVETITNEKLSVFCEENPNVARAICMKVLDAARARDAARKARELVRRKGAFSSSNLPTKLADCSSRNRENTELFIVEGLSAGGTAKQGRDRNFQAILPLRGVILNVEKARVDKMLANEEIRALISAIGTGIGSEDFDISKLRYGKIIIMADADIDGAHIRTLLLTFFFRHMPQLIADGHIFIAQPPLYKVRRRSHEEYVFDDRRFESTLLELGMQGTRVEVQPDENAAPRIIEEEELRKVVKTLVKMREAVQAVEKTGLTLNELINASSNGQRLPLYYVEQNDERKYFFSDDEVSEFLRRAHDAKSTQEGSAESEAESAARDQTDIVREIRGAETFNELLEQVEQCGVTLQLFQRPAVQNSPTPDEKEPKEPIKLITRDDVIRLGTVLDLLDQLFELGRQGLTVQRYKGLGEMNADELAETTMNPDKRTLLRVNIEDAVVADQIFTILAGKNVEKRREYIREHALEAKNIDV